jgi:uncharacterized membrane protein YdbT with pleckstrin-like domain
MRYQKVWDRNLVKGEEVLFEFSISDRFRNVNLIFAAMISIPLLFIYGLGLLVFLPAWFMLGFYLKVANAYALTNRRVIIKRGWLSTHTISIEYDRITDVSIKQPFFERLLYKTGTLYVNTAGTEVHEVLLTHIARPYELKKRLNECIDHSEMENKKSL